MSPSRTFSLSITRWVSFESSFSPTKEPPRTTPEGKQKEHILARKTSTRALEVSSSKTRLRESSQNARARARISVFFSPFFLFSNCLLPSLSLPPHEREKKCRGRRVYGEERKTRRSKTPSERANASFDIIPTRFHSPTSSS